MFFKCLLRDWRYTIMTLLSEKHGFKQTVLSVFTTGKVMLQAQRYTGTHIHIYEERRDSADIYLSLVKISKM